MTRFGNDGRIEVMYNLLPLLISTIVLINTTINVNESAAVQELPNQKTVVEHLQIKEKLEKLEVVEVKTYTAKDSLSPEELKDILREAGFSGDALRLAWGTAMKESTGRPMAHNKNSNTGDNSYGLFQINMIGSLGPARLEQYKLNSNDELFDPLTNAKIAYHMSNGGKNWSAWHGITDSTRKWMEEFPN